MTESININQFAQTPIKGTLDLQISARGVISGLVSDNETDPVTAGAKVKLDTANTGPIPTFVLADESEEGFGLVIFNTQHATVSAPKAIEVAYFGGPVIYLEGAGTVAPGAAVQFDADGNVEALDSDAQVGIALDPVAAGVVSRIIIKLAPVAE